MNSTDAIMVVNVWTRVMETCFTVSALRCTAANNAKGQKVRDTLLHLANICILHSHIANHKTESSLSFYLKSEK